MFNLEFHVSVAIIEFRVYVNGLIFGGHDNKDVINIPGEEWV